MPFSALVKNVGAALTWASLGLGSLAAACSEDDDANGVGDGSRVTLSCTQQTGARCEEYKGAGTPFDLLSNACSMGNGKVGTGCSRTGVSGVCTKTEGEKSYRDVRYRLDAGAADTFKHECESDGGVWAAS